MPINSNSPRSFTKMRTRRKSQYGASRRRSHHGGEGEETETTTTGEETTTTGEAPVDIMRYEEYKLYHLGDMVLKVTTELKLYRLKNEASTSEDPTTHPDVWSPIELFTSYIDETMQSGVKNYALDELVYYVDNTFKVAKRVQPAADQPQYEAGQPPILMGALGQVGVIEPNPSAWKVIAVVPVDILADAKQDQLNNLSPLILTTNVVDNIAIIGEDVHVTASGIMSHELAVQWYFRTSAEAEWEQRLDCNSSSECTFHASTPGTLSIKLEMPDNLRRNVMIDIEVVTHRVEGENVKITTSDAALASGDNWSSYVYATKPTYSGVARVSFSSGFDGNEENPNISNIVGGFTETPTATGAPKYTYLKYGIQINKDGVFIMENGVNKAQVANHATYNEDIASIVYDGTSVKYYWNYVLVYTSTQTQTNTLYAYITLESGGMRFQNFSSKAVGVLEMPATTTAGQEGGGRRRTRSKRRHGRRSSRKRGAQNLRHGKRM